MKQASTTAVGVAALRAVHQLMDGEPKLLEDPVILRLLDPGFPGLLKAHPEKYLTWPRQALKSHVLLRSRFAEDCLKEAYDRGLRQYLLLGAGFDTFAYRQPAWAKDLRIYEADHPGSQAHKRERLEVAGIQLPANLRFVPVDLEADGLRAALESGSFDFRSPVFISCLGVLMYLRPDTVAGLFRFVASLPPGSEIVFTFARKERIGWPFSLASKAASVGEPWLTLFSPHQLARQLKAAGFSRFFFLSPEEAVRRYFRDRTDGLMPPRRVSIVRAIV